MGGLGRRGDRPLDLGHNSVPRGGTPGRGRPLLGRLPNGQSGPACRQGCRDLARHLAVILKELGVPGFYVHMEAARIAVERLRA